MPQRASSSPLPVTLLGLLLVTVVASAQGPPAPPFGAGQGQGQGRRDRPSDPGPTAAALSESIDRLTNEVSRRLPQTPSTRSMISELQELNQSVAEFRSALRLSRDRFARRSLYAGIDQTWHHLQPELARAGSRTPSIGRQISEVDQLNQQVLVALGMNVSENDFYESPQPLTGIKETRRLAVALVDRAEAVQSVISTDLVRTPNRNRLIRNAAELVRASDEFHDNLRPRGGRPEVDPNAFASVTKAADLLGADLATLRLSPKVQSAWQGFVSAQNLISQQLGIQETVVVVPRPVTVRPLPPPPPPPLLQWSDALLTQVDEFLRVFSASSQKTPEFGQFMEDAQRLKAAALKFRESVAARLPTGALAFAFRDVNHHWSRLARRVQRVAKGRTGPNIQQVQRMGETCDQIHQALGMPGYPPTTITSVVPSF